MTRARFWSVTYWALLAAWLLAAVLVMRGVHAGFLTSYLADLTQPAWLYVYCRGLAPQAIPRWQLIRAVGRTPERAGLLLFGASAATECGQWLWPHGLMAGRWDPYDVVAFGIGIGCCFALERWWTPRVVQKSIAEERAV